MIKSSYLNKILNIVNLQLQQFSNQISFSLKVFFISFLSDSFTNNTNDQFSFLFLILNVNLINKCEICQKGVLRNVIF